jgi:neurexin
MELLDGHLHVHLDLGTGSVNIRASRVPLNDGQWHHVELTLKRRMGRITIDGATEAFETPGKWNKRERERRTLLITRSVRSCK